MKIFADNIPIYLQLKTEVENAILSGGLKAEEGIESIRAMAAKYSINPLTVSKAIQELESEGIIYKKRGIGFYVAADALTNLRSKHMQTYLETEVQSFVQKARQLKLSLADLHSLIEKNYSAAGNNVIPVSVVGQPVRNDKEKVTKVTDNESNPSPHPFNTGLRPATPDHNNKEI